jgi:hypothetical protein
VGVLLGRQVQRRVTRVQVGMPAPAVGQTGDGDLAEDRSQDASVAGFDRAARHPVHVADRLQALLAVRTQVEVVLQQLAQQLAALSLQLGFELGMGQPAGVRARRSRGRR